MPITLVTIPLPIHQVNQQATYMVQATEVLVEEIQVIHTDQLGRQLCWVVGEIVALTKTPEAALFRLQLPEQPYLTEV